MSKKDISKLLTSGSPKQRLLLLAEDNAMAKFGQSRLLTAHEINQLTVGFKKPDEIKLWNRWLNVDRVVTTSLMNLQSLKFEVLMHYSDLRGYIMVWETQQEAELISNHILHEIKDQVERKKISNQVAKMNRFLLTSTAIDKEGYLDINIDFERDTCIDENGKWQQTKQRKTREYSLWHVMNNVKEKAVNSAIKFISWKKAILDYMEEEGFIIKTYTDMIYSMNEEIQQPIIGWTKYQSDEQSFIPEIPERRVDKLKGKYAITPDIKKIDVDAEIYEHVKSNCLG